MELKSNMPSDAWEQLCWLRDMTRRTGMLHDAQILQMKMWPRVLFEGCSKSQASVDVDSRSVVYEVHLKAAGKKQEALAETLSDYTKNLLGSEWAVSVQVTAKGKTKTFAFAGEDRD